MLSGCSKHFFGEVPVRRVSGCSLRQYVMTRHNRDLPGPHDAIALQNVEGQTIHAGDLWQTQPVLILCLRRLGCSMFSARTESRVRPMTPVTEYPAAAVLCRAEAKKLWADKAAFDNLGMRMVCVVHQMPVTEYEVRYLQLLHPCTTAATCIAELLTPAHQHQALRTSSDAIYEQQEDDCEMLGRRSSQPTGVVKYTWIMTRSSLLWLVAGS